MTPKRDPIENAKEALMACVELIMAQDAYIEYLGKAEKMTVGFLYAHNWRYPDEIIEEGAALRARIREASAKFGELFKALGLKDP